jgi:hypothetical protein
MPVNCKHLRGAAAFAAALGLWLGTAGQAEASLARKLGQPISAYSASLFGKTNLTSLETQTLTCDPDEPLGGSTSTLYDPSIVRVTGFGRGPGYLAGNSNSPFPSGAGIEILDGSSPNGKSMMDLEAFLNPPVGKAVPTETGYLRFYFLVTGEGVSQTGKLTDDFNFVNVTHPGYTLLGSNGPVGVDTHYYDFTYLQPDDPRPAGYTVFAESADKHYIVSPDNPSVYNLLDSDFVVTQDAPTEQLRPGGDVPFEPASITGSIVPEPAAATLLLGAAAIATLARKRRRA